MSKLQRKAIWIEFKSDIHEYGFLNALNNFSFEIGYLRTLPFTEDREIVFERYKLRKAKIQKFGKKLYLNMTKLQKKAIWIEFKSDIREYGFLNALNKLSFEFRYFNTLPFTEDREIVFERYKLRKAKIQKFRKKLHLGD